MNESDVESIGSGSGSGANSDSDTGADESLDKSVSVHFSDDDDDDIEDIEDIEKMMESPSSSKNDGDDDDNDNSDNDDDDEEDQDILHKFDSETKKNTLQATTLNVYHSIMKKPKPCLESFEMKMEESLTRIIKRCHF